MLRGMCCGKLHIMLKLHKIVHFFILMNDQRVYKST